MYSVSKLKSMKNMCRKSHKGVSIPSAKPRKRGEAASKRGISNEKVCIITAVQRLGKAVARTFNMAKPTSEDCLKFGQHIEENSYAWTDGLVIMSI